MKTNDRAKTHPQYRHYMKTALNCKFIDYAKTVWYYQCADRKSAKQTGKQSSESERQKPPMGWSCH